MNTTGIQISREQIALFIGSLIQELPDFIDEEWPKGNADRGIAITVLALYLAHQKRKWKINL